MTDFLLELRSEEIPARMQAKARDDLARLFTAELAKAGIATSEIVTYATPRRLTLIARDLPVETAAVSEEVKGPKASAPPQALEGFLRKTGLTREQLTERDGILFAVTEKPGRATAAVLAEAIPAIVRGFPWPKSMRWGDASATTESLKWVRPLQGIVALFGEMIVPFEIAGIESGAATLGHRFHHAGPITIGGAHDYVDKLRMAHVLVDQDERATLIRDRAREAAAQAGLELVEDEGLVAENAGLTEWPVPLLGQFDPAFLDVPPEVIQLTARVNQKYFVCRSADGSLANAFVCTANIDAADGGAKIVEGNRKVLAARLSDAKFFYDTDLKMPLAEQAEKLSKIVFHEKLGTVADKVDRVAKLARWLVEEGIVTESPSRLREGLGEGVSANDAPSVTSPPPTPPVNGRGALADLADRAARLAKADLVTGMVGEFPELQGLMGGYYAAAQGEDPQVAAAIRDHYKPVGQGDDVPTDPVTVAVSLADKLDTLASFFTVGELPTGSRDPFALRRAALGILELISKNNLRLPIYEAINWQYRTLATTKTTGWHVYFIDWSHGASLRYVEQADISLLDARELWVFEHPATHPGFQPPFSEKEALAYSRARLNSRKRSRAELISFLADRLKVQQREAGVRHGLIDAVFALGGEDDLVRLLARVHALQAFVATEDGTNLLAGYKRAANILKKEAAPAAKPVTPAQEQRVEHAPHAQGLSGGQSDPLLVSGDGVGQEPRETPAFAGVTDENGAGAQNSLSYTPEPAEAALIAALDSAEPRAASSVAAEDFAGAMAALASLRAPIDAFFDNVTVNDPDPARRTARLALLERVRAAVHNVADFSKVEG